VRLYPLFVRAACMAWLLLLSGCGGTTHVIPCAGVSDVCVLQRFVYATTAANELLIFPVSQTGTLGSPSSLPGPAITGGRIAVSPSSRELFVADHVLDTLSAFVVNVNNQYSPAPGSPYSVSGTGSLESVAVTADGKFVYVVGLGGRVSAFSIASNGSLAPIPGSPFPIATNSVDAVTDAAGKFLFIVSASNISGFAINSSTGALTSTGTPVALPGLTLPTPAMAATTPGASSFLFVALNGANSVAAFSFDSTTGVLAPVSGSPFAAGTGPISVTTTTSALYVTNSGDGTMSAFTWDKNTGALTAVNGSPFSAPWGAGLASLNGQYLYVASVNNVFPPFANSILGYSINASGAVTPLSGSPYPAGVQLWGGIAAF
jgi:3-carboxymuconate cyclase